MTRRLILAIAATFLALAAASCAVSGGPDGAGPSAYSPPPSDPARIGLPPAYRPFFDALRDDGDWTLIEPYGWCFRPRVNFVAWRPYLDGWWEPSQTWGWIWNTNEPFGWITYHYGSWFYDSYQGWVWQPGSVWGPAWVAWVEVGDFVGWAPLAPGQWDGSGQAPGGMFTFAEARQMAARDVGQQALYLARLPQSGAAAHAIVNTGRVDGVTFNRGPDFERMQRMGAMVPGPQDAGALPRVKLGGPAARPAEADLLARTSRVVAEGTREWRMLREKGVAPPPIPGGDVRLPAPPPARPPGYRDEHAGHAKPAGRDSSAAGHGKPAARDSSGASRRHARTAEPDSTRDH